MLCLSSNGWVLLQIYPRTIVFDCHFWKSAQGYNHLFRIAQASKRGRQDCQTHATWLEYDGEMKTKLKTFYFMIFEFKDPVVYNCSFMFHPRVHSNASKAWPLTNIHWWKEALDTVGFRLGWRCLMVCHMVTLLQMIQPDSPLRLEIYHELSW